MEDFTEAARGGAGGAPAYIQSARHVCLVCSAVRGAKASHLPACTGFERNSHNSSGRASSSVIVVHPTRSHMLCAHSVASPPGVGHPVAESAAARKTMIKEAARQAQPYVRAAMLAEQWWLEDPVLMGCIVAAAGKPNWTTFRKARTEGVLVVGWGLFAGSRHATAMFHSGGDRCRCPLCSSGYRRPHCCKPDAVTFAHLLHQERARRERASAEGVYADAPVLRGLLARGHRGIGHSGMLQARTAFFFLLR